jgi:hypothetical protein
MGTPNVVPTVEEDAQAEEAQGRSTIKFPYLDQDDAVEVAKAIHTIAGKSCERDQLAAHFNVAARGGAFSLRLLTAKLFGFINSDKGTLTLTPLGSRVCDPQQEKAARAESFLLVPLYKAIYDDYKGQTLPGNPGLETAMEQLGVAPKQRDKARQVFQRSATQAGYFAYGTSRLVAPAMKAAVEEEKSKTEDGVEDEGEKEKPEKKKRHPFIEGLLDKLPVAETEWTMEGRKKWLQTASNIFDLMYTAPSDEGELSVTLTKTSAK